MSSVILRFTSKWPYNIGSLAVATLSGSRDFSHVMMIVGSDVFEATMQHGCRKTSLSEAMRNVVKFQEMHIDVPDIDACIAFGEAQVGKPYDFAGAIGIPFLHSTDWNDDSKWWCSELVFAMLGAGGIWLLDPNEKTRVTQNDLHQCNYEKSSLIVLS